MDLLSPGSQPDPNESRLCDHQPYLTCHTLQTAVERLDRLELTYCCSTIEAVRLLALYLENKSLMLPRFASQPQGIFRTDMRICLLTPRQVALGPFYAETSPEGVWERLKLLRFWGPILSLRRLLEKMVSETVFEVFHPSGESWTAGQKLEAEKAERLAVAHLRFHNLGNGRCYLRVFFGGNEGVDEKNLVQLLSFLDDYLSRLQFAFGQPSLPRQSVFGTPQEQVHPGQSLIPPAHPVELAGETAKSSPPSEPVKDGATAVPAPPPAQSPTELTAARVNASMLPPARRPRLYKNSLLKICRLAAHRQAALAQGDPIPDIVPLINQYGISPNTIGKASNLMGAWKDPAFGWNVVVWLREHSGHSAEEITDYLNHLRTSLNQEEWALVTVAT
jgi:hypothetical protein